MKNFEKIYRGIKAIEEETLFKFKGQDDLEDFVFVYDSVIFDYSVTIDEDDFSISNNNESVSNILLNSKELKLFLSFMRILKECEE